MRTEHETREGESGKEMGKIRILADSTCDLTLQMLQQYGVQIVPLNIVLNDKAYQDGVEIGPDEIYAWSEAHKTTPKTSAMTLGAAQEALSTCSEPGDDIICFCISEQMSSAAQVMRLAAEDLPDRRVYVIDSQNLSTGIGLQVLYAVEQVQAGTPAEEIVRLTEQRRQKVRASFVVDTLTYLYRGGRCNAVTALVGNALQLKPKIVVQDGKMGVSKKYRGKTAAIVQKYAQDLQEQLLNADARRVFVTHSGMPDGIVEQTVAYLQSLHYFEEVLTSRAGGVISSHCGPGTLGVLFYTK